MTKICVSRGSDLALIQVREVCEALPFATRLLTVQSEGDLKPELALHSFKQNGVFTSQVEAALLAGEGDFCVHSLKDMPSDLPASCSLAAVTTRRIPRDVLVLPQESPWHSLDDLPETARIGTSSARRRLQLLLYRPDLRLLELRGNVPRRLDKLAQGDYEAIVLAEAGLSRLGLLDDARFRFVPLDLDLMIPACGQGSLALECRADDHEMIEALRTLEDPEARLAYEVERRIQAFFASTCHAPVAAYCERDDEGYLYLRAVNGTGGVETARRFCGRISREAWGRQDEDLLRQALADLAGPIYLAGAGPGDPELATAACRRLLAEADTVLYDRLGTVNLLGFCRADAELIYVGKAKDRHQLPQREIEALLIRKALAGRMVLRLKGGDPLTFGRAAEELLALQKAGLRAAVVPGLSSALSGPALAGMALTWREHEASFTILSGRRAVGEQVDPDLLPKKGNLVYLMGLAELEACVQAALAAGRAPDCPALLIESASLPSQREVEGTLATIVQLAEQEAVQSPCLFCVGDGIQLRHELGSDATVWQERRYPKRQALAGRRFWLTRTAERLAGGPDHHFAEQLREAGADVLEVPLLHLKQSPLQAYQGKKLLRQLHESKAKERLVILTSARAVECFFSLWRELNYDWRELAEVRFAVTGAGTAKRLKDYGLLAEIVPERHYAAGGLAEAIVAAVDQAAELYYLHAAVISGVLNERLSAAGFTIQEAIVYEMEQRKLEAGSAAFLLEQCDSIVVTSSSAGRALVAQCAHLGMSAEQLSREKEIIALGPFCAADLESAGCHVSLRPERTDMDALLETIMQHRSCRLERRI